MEKQKTISTITKKRKRKIKSTASEPNNMKSETEKAAKVAKLSVGTQKITLPNVMFQGLNMEEISEKYPVLKNEELVKRFLSVPMTNNQKGRIRQVLKDNLKGTSDILLPDVIYNRIQSILKSSENLTDADLRKLRILYNMLKTATQNLNVSDKPKKKVKNKQVVQKNKTKKEKEENVKESGDPKEKEKRVKENSGPQKEKTEDKVKKIKGPKRYVVFVGNLPIDVDKEKILHHFSQLSNHIKDIRIPKRGNEKKSAIAYVELNDEPSYELALSKHHSMLDNRRINVLYTTQKKGKIGKTEAKSKAAKLVALQKAGKLLGSAPITRKRSYRRKKRNEAFAIQTSHAA